MRWLREDRQRQRQRDWWGKPPSYSTPPFSSLHREENEKTLDASSLESRRSGYLGVSRCDDKQKIVTDPQDSNERDEDL
ncbi:hypothetical protein V1477_006745 [Vespula maculifrons]|uniref:Uncharacterized protein n=1 Tax=Vespula maculifrons TaxID=7453 RepID=A0ABD2CGK0_VESMC